MIRPELLALYGGPDQIMGLASGLATVVGVLLMFWNKVMVTMGKIVRVFRPSTEPQETPENQ